MRTLRTAFKQKGIDCIYDREGRGRKSILPKDKHEDFKNRIVERQKLLGGGRLTGEGILQILRKDFGVSYCLNGVYSLLKSLGMSWVSGRSAHPKRDAQAQDAFKKNFLAHVASVMPSNIDINQVDIWFQDESRVGQQGSITRIWHFTGDRPRLVRQQQFEYAYIYGAICPATGDSAALVLPCANGEGMKRHIEEISKQVPEGRHAVLVVDGAGWHQETMRVKNVSILKLPPYSPELNPVEQVWQWLKQNHLSNRCFSGYNDIVDACCKAWNIFANCTDLVKRIGVREWAKIAC